MSNAIFTATAEQSSILTAVQAGQNLIINAFAGTGKSSTLRHVAKSMPNTKFLYLVFNASAKADAAKTFPDNVSVFTFHGLAHTGIVKKSPYADVKLESFWDISRYSKAIDDDKREITGKVISILQEYCKSDFASISEIYPVFQDVYNPEIWEFLCGKAQLLWEQIGHNGLPITHDWYLKMYQLSNPVLNGFDIIMIDEAQDMNPVQLDIIKRQTQQTILVGDRFQGIYAWRGAVNAMNQFNSFDQRFLTESFRFSQEIADVAGMALSALGAEKRLIGRGSKTTIERTGILVRSNFGLFMSMVNLSKQGKSFYAEIDTQELFNMIYTASAMRHSFKTGQAPKYGEHPNAKIKSFYDWKGLCDSNDADCKRVVRLVECGFGHKDIMLIKSYMVKSPELTDTIIVSGHKSKGLEYDRIIIGADFLPWDYDGYSREKIKQFIQDQGLNLLYVGLTRGRVEVVIDDEVRQFLTIDLVRYASEIGVDTIA